MNLILMLLLDDPSLVLNMCHSVLDFKFLREGG